MYKKGLTTCTKTRPQIILTHNFFSLLRSIRGSRRRRRHDNHHIVSSLSKSAVVHYTRLKGRPWIGNFPSWSAIIRNTNKILAIRPSLIWINLLPYLWPVEPYVFNTWQITTRPEINESIINNMDTHTQKRRYVPDSRKNTWLVCELDQIR